MVNFEYTVMKKIIYTLGILWFFIASCNTSSKESGIAYEYPHYEIKLRIDPTEQEIFVEGKLLIDSIRNSPNDMSFYLDKGMNIKSFTLNNELSFIKDTSVSDIRFMPEAAKLYIGKDVVKNNRKIEINFEYGGKLSELPEYFANTISKEWIELGEYYPWFPYNPKNKLFTYDLEIEIDSEYHVFGMGKVNNAGIKKRIINNTPTNDIVVCAAKDISVKEWQIGANTISIYHDNFADTLLNKMEVDLSSIIKLYNKWFGDKSQNIIIVESKREKGGGYARIGGVFLGGFKSEKYYKFNEGYHRYLAHELGHLWWFKANTSSWEDWLNEGFAEYSALMVIRKVFGEDAFMKRLDVKKESLKDTPPIWGFDRNSDSEAKTIELILYNKAPILLNMLENRIGKVQFIGFTKRLLQRNITSTQEFLEVLEQQEGEKVSGWFKELLHTY